MIQFAYTILYVADVAASITFYEKAFGWNRKFISPEMDYAELALGETTLSFAAHSLGHANFKEGFIPSKLEHKPFGIEIAFSTDKVADYVSAAIDAGATLVSPPSTKPWGQMVAYVRDIDGFLIEICSPMS